MIVSSQNAAKEEKGEGKGKEEGQKEGWWVVLMQFLISFRLENDRVENYESEMASS